MKKEQGVTLISLMVYVIVSSMILLVMTVIIHQFYQNADNLEAKTEDILAWNKFNTYFIKEIKQPNNAVDTINGNYILFATGNSFSLLSDKLYYNNTKICDNVVSFGISKQVNEDNILNVTLQIGEFTKNMQYKVEEIY